MMAKRKARAVSKTAARPRPVQPDASGADWDDLEDALAGGTMRSKQQSAADLEVDRLFDYAERAQLQQLARRAKLTRSRQAPLGNVVLLPGLTGSNLDVIDRSGDKDYVWINYFRIFSGRLTDLQLAPSGSAEADARLTVRASGINKSFYARAVMALRARWNVAPLAYDWRRDIDEASDRLADFLRARFADQPCHLVAHSHGGLVARNFIRRHPQIWERIKDPKLVAGGRLIMLGTPNYGSFAIPPVLTGTEDLIQTLAAIDVVHSLRELLAISNTFVGTYLSLPAPSRLKPHLQSIYSKETWGDAPGVSQRHLNRAFEFQSALEQAPTIDPARMLYVAGTQRVTPAGMAIVAAGEFEYELTTDGDGRVSHALGLLPGVPTYYIDEVHGDLARNETVLNAIDEMLQSGATGLLGTVPRRLRAEPHSLRSARSAASAQRSRLSVIARQALTSEALLNDADRRFAEQAIINSALGADLRSIPQAPPATEKTGKAPAPQQRLQVELELGDIAEFDAPLVVVGHYRGVLPTNAIGAIDRKLGGWIEQAVRHGMIAGTLGETFYVPHMHDAGSIVIAGMGEFGQFSAPDLRLVMSNVVHGACALGYTKIATVLVGAGNGSLGCDTALREILGGCANGLVQSGAEALRLVIVERSAARFFEIAEGLAGLTPESLASVQIVLARPTAQQTRRARSAARRQSKRMTEKTADRADEVRITIEFAESTHAYRFAALSPQAVVPVREVAVSALALDAGRALCEAITREEQDKYGRLLYDYLMPQDFTALLDGPHPLRLIVDAHTAVFPWEMACFASSRAAGGSAALHWLGTDLRLSRQFRTMLSQAPGILPPLNDRLRVLVIADPAPEPELRLPNARLEGRRVARLFADADGQSLGSGILRVEVVERIGAGACDPIELLALLLTGGFDIVHYAGHGEYAPHTPEKSGWIFGDGTVLSARDIFRARKVPRLVFANACFSAAAAATADTRPELARATATIAQAFFERGVPNYIGAGWRIDDEQAPAFAEAFYRALLRRESIGTAMLAARRSLFDAPGSSWGAYQHYGNPQDRVLPSQRLPTD